MESGSKNYTAPRRLKLLVTIVNREKAELYADLLQSCEIHMQTAVLARGTAGTETLNMLGLDDTEKAVIFSVVREDRAADALSLLEDRFDKIKNGKGIAFTVPLTGTIGVAVYRFLSNNTEGVETKWNSPTK